MSSLENIFSSAKYVKPCSQTRHRSLNSDLEPVISIGGILVDAIPLERIILAILVANVMSVHQTGPRCRRIPYQQNTHTFSSRHVPFITHPQCLRAGIAQATQLQSLHLPLFKSKHGSTMKG